MLGTTWQYHEPRAGPTEAVARRWNAILPTEGVDRVVGQLDDPARTPSTRTARYVWINWITKPDVQAQVAEYFGEAPANLKACTTSTDATRSFCTTYQRRPTQAVLRPALVLDHADDQVPRRPHRREVRGVQGLDLGLGRDQGQLTPALASTSGAGRQPVRPPVTRCPPSTTSRASRLRVAGRRGASRRRPARHLGRSARLAPLTWLLVVYIGSLVALLVTSLYSLADDPTGLLHPPRHASPLDNYERLWNTPVYREVALRTRHRGGHRHRDRPRRSRCRSRSTWRRSRRRGRGAPLVVAMTMPLWAGYLVKGYAWRAILDPGGRRAAGGVRLRARVRLTEHDHRRSATCGCRTW